MTKKQTRAQGQEQTQFRPISVSFSHGTLSFESVAHARQSVGWFVYHNRAIAQILGEQLQSIKEVDAELVCSLGFLNRDMAELICAIETEIGGAV
jgi:hypothetical protein